MSEYENRIFETLTSSEEKFKSANEIAKHMKRVKDRLIETFWQEVEKKMKAINRKRNSGFCVHLDKSILGEHSKCYFYLKGYQDIRIQYVHLASELSMGLGFRPDRINFRALNEYRGKHLPDLSEISENSWWLISKKKNIDFSNSESLVLILPKNLEDYSNQKANELFDFANKNEAHLRYIVENCLIKDPS